MQVITDIQKIKQLCQSWRDNGESIAFVPTMGCLHDGHLSLVKKAKSVAEHVVVSIFVNPLQFNDKDDLLKYPRSEEDDIAKLSPLAVDAVFIPNIADFYMEGEKNVEQVKLGELTEILEGENRPGHFSGVATVVKRFFEIINPNMAIFGEKDFQQLMVIKALVAVFKLDIEIIGLSTFREEDGLAMSSRNLRLNDDERIKASKIYQQLDLIKKQLLQGATNYTVIEENAFKSLEQAGFVPDYVVIRDVDTLMPPKNLDSKKVILIAAKLGEVRLIDNIRV